MSEAPAKLKPADVRRAAMDLLARREHSCQELVRKLTRRLGDHPELFEQEISRLREDGLQSDLRLAEAFIRARAGKGHGPVKIRMELRGKQVDDETINSAFESNGIDWFERVADVAAKKFDDDTLGSGEAKTRSRVSRFLQQRGFSFDHISSIF